MANRAVSREWSRAAKTLIERVGASLEAGEARDGRPERLYHFTDCAGLVNVFESKCLWASLATSLNDRSEVTYGISKACSLFKSGAITARHLPLVKMPELLSVRAQSRAYIISFCARVDTALHWLHYGHSGSGVAIGFYSDRLQKRPFYLFEVLYQEEQQIALIRSIVDTVDNSLEEFLSGIGDERQRSLLIDVAAESAADHLWMASPRMKNVAFEAEREWRLITYDPKGQGIPSGEGPTGKTFFRTVGGRAIPYKKLLFDSLPIFEIVLGSSAAMEPDELGLAVVIDEAFGGRLTISRSSVPIRG